MAKILAMIACAVAIPGLAQAATTGSLNGTYTINFTQICQSIDNETLTPTSTGNGGQYVQTLINTIDQGGITQTVGFLQFKPAKAGALTGTVSANLTQTNGSLTILGLPGPPASPATPDMQLSSAATTGTYALTLGTGLTASTLTLTFSGKSPITLTGYVSGLKAAIYDHIDFINIQGNSSGAAASCSLAGALNLQ